MLNNQSMSFVTSRTKVKETQTSKESLEAFALFSGIYKSKNFTIDAAHRAFSGVVRKK